MVLVAMPLLCLAACSSTTGLRQGSSSNPPITGQNIEVLAVWSGVEQARFEDVLRSFEHKTRTSVTYTAAGSGVPEALKARAEENRLPDVAFLPQPGLLHSYVDHGWIQPLDATTAAQTRRNYGTAWQALAAVDGRPYGVWFKAANKSVVWYNVAVFERFGLIPPVDLAGLARIANSLRVVGIPAFSVGGADPWTLTDWFENIYLRTAGAARYEQLTSHNLPWTDASVKEALRKVGELLSPSSIAGGAAGAVQMTFPQSVEQTFADPPLAAMVFEGDFVANFISDKIRPGVDADVFAFPALDPSGLVEPALIGGGDLAVQLRPSAAANAFMQYLATPDAAAIWAARGGFLSPNVNLDLSVYPDDTTRSMARALLDAGSGFHFDLSDQQPGGFGSSKTEGLRKRLQDFLLTGDVDGTAAGLEADAVAAFGR